MRFMSRGFMARLLLAAGSLIAIGLQAQTYPARPVTLVVPFPPGGSADILARTVGQKLALRLGQSVVVENKAGAGTAMGARFVAESAPDGHTLLLGTVSSQAINPAMSKVGYDPVRDFTAVSPLASIPFVLVAHPAATMNTVADVIQAARSKPGAVGYASAGPGTSNHLAGELFSTAARIQMMHVPYRGSAPALADVLAGHVPLMFDLQATSLPNLRTQKLKALAVTGSQRSPLLPDVPTVAESGLPGFEVSAWFGIFAPSKVPSTVIKRLSDELATVLKSPDMVQRLRELGVDVDGRTQSEFAAYVREEAAKYTAIVKGAGLAP